MPDQYGFNHLPDWGIVRHRCIHCDWPETPRTLTERERERHHLQHERERRKEAAKARDASLRKARKTKAEIATEEALLAERLRS
jgi:hypothetical protein